MGTQIGIKKLIVATMTVITGASPYYGDTPIYDDTSIYEDILIYEDKPIEDTPVY